MTKNDLIRVIAQTEEVSMQQARFAVDSTVQAILDAMKSGESVQIPGFGTFEVVDKPSRMVRNPRTKEIQEAPAHKAFRFRAGKTLKDAARNGQE